MAQVCSDVLAKEHYIMVHINPNSQPKSTIAWEQYYNVLAAAQYQMAHTAVKDWNVSMV